MITRDTDVEELLQIPGVIAWCVQHGVSPFSCSGAFPGSLERLLELKGVRDIDGFVGELDAAFPRFSPPEEGPSRRGSGA